MSPLLLRQILLLRVFAFEKRFQEFLLKPKEQRAAGGLQAEVFRGRCLGLPGQPSQTVSPFRPSKPQEAEQHKSQPQVSIWTLDDSKPRMWDAKHVSNLRRVSLNLGPACKSTFPIPESWERLLSLRGALLPSSGAWENGMANPFCHLHAKSRNKPQRKEGKWPRIVVPGPGTTGLEQGFAVKLSGSYLRQTFAIHSPLIP